MGKAAGSVASQVWLPQPSIPAPQKVSSLLPRPCFGREQADGDVGTEHHQAAPSAPCCPSPQRCPAWREASGTHPRGLGLLPHVGVPGAPLVPIRGREGDVTLTWNQDTQVARGPRSLPVPTGYHGPHRKLTPIAATPGRVHAKVSQGLGTLCRAVPGERAPESWG